MLSRFRRLFLILLSAVLLALPFHFGNLWALSFFAFLPYFFAIENCSTSESTRYSYLFGCAFFALLGFWLVLVNVIGFVVMVLYLALYFAAFGALSAHFLRAGSDFEKNDIGHNIKAAFFIPAFWVLLEYLRGWLISGIPWALLAYSQWRNLSFIQIADWTGAYGISYFVLLANLLFFKLLRIWTPDRGSDQNLSQYGTHKRKLFLSLVGILAGLFVFLYAYGTWTLHARDAFYGKVGDKTSLRVAVVQGNIPQELKWDAKIKNIILEKYKRLTFMSAVEKSDLIIWPETSFPGYLEDEPLMASRLRTMVRQTKTNVLVGAPTIGGLEQGLRFYNSALLFGPDGEERKRYSKVHLVPFGEYVPLEPVLGFIRYFYAIGHFSPGKEITIFQVNSRYQAPSVKARFGVLICYEDIFPGLVREFCQGGADFLINITNDAWFGKTSAPYQHAQASLFRAVENRVNVVRATNTGLSCFISPEGRILSTVQDQGQEIFVTGRKTQDIILRKTPTFYTRFGDVFIALMGLLAFLAYREKNKHSAYTRL